MVGRLRNNVGYAQQPAQEFGDGRSAWCSGHANPRVSVLTVLCAIRRKRRESRSSEVPDNVESDRAVAVLAAAYLDALLGDLLAAHFVNDIRMTSVR